MELHLEQRNRQSLVGAVCRGRVARVAPGIEAAFVNIGLERDAFLYAGDLRHGVTALEELEAETDEPAEPATEDQRPIDELLSPGQELVVQVLKDPLPGKGARITTQVALPGRYLVLLPTDRDLGVSRRIEEEEERDRLRLMLEELSGERGGLIARTAAHGKERDDLERDLRYLTRLWEEINRKADDSESHFLLHRDQDLCLRVVRDLLDPSYELVWVDGDDAYERVVQAVHDLEPDLADRVRRWQEETPLFDRFGVEEEIEAALKSKVWLPSGGSLVINQTEALVAIDVNTGRFRGGESLEETVVKTNLEAVREVVRQIRLRDLSGIIVVDFIDMEEPENRERVFLALEEELALDRAKNQVLRISEFGLVEITRKRSQANLERLLTRPCPYCRGRGRIKDIATICLDLRRRLLARRRQLQGRPLLLRLHPEVARALQYEQIKVLQELESSLATTPRLEQDASLHHEEFEIVEL